MIEAAFWTAVLLLAYVYVGYPVLIWSWARGWPRPVRGNEWEPTVTVLVAAHDEGRRIATKLENLLGLDYPMDRLEVLVGSDGSTDNTVARARAFEGPTVRVLDFAARRGKPAVLNDLAREARGEVLVMADVRQVFDKAALRALVSPLADPTVGAVGGQLILLDGEADPAVTHGVGVYWRYEKLIRRSESFVDSTVGATGAIYAVRRALWEPLPENTFLDDVVLPLRLTRRGHRVLFEPSAIAFDRAAATSAEELTRKVRTIAGTFQLFQHERWLLDPRVNRLWLQTVSHKGLRLLGPVLLAVAAGTSAALASQPLYAVALALQVLFYALALTGAFVRSTNACLLSVPFVFCLLNWAIVLAFAALLRGRQGVTWRKATA